MESQRRFGPVAAVLAACLFAGTGLAVAAGDHENLRSRRDRALFATIGLIRTDGCVRVEVSVEPGQVCPGGTVKVTASVTNCGEFPDRVTLSATSSGAIAASASMLLGPGETKSVEREQVVPEFAPPGAYPISVTAKSARGGTDSASVTIEVVDCE